MHRQPVADHRYVGTGALDVRRADGQGVFPIRHLAAHQAVGLLVLQEDHRVVVANGRFEQALGLVGRGRGDHDQAWGVEKQGFHVLRVKQAAADAAAVGDADGHRNLQRTVGAVVGAGRLADELVDAGPDEIGELHFGNGPHAAKRRAQGDAHDGRFGQRRVDNPLRAEILDESLRRQENATALAHVLAHDENALVLLHLFVEGRAHRFD